MKVLHSKSVVRETRAFMPPIDGSASSLRKGQSGRILVVGGSSEYTGAPFYASMAALRSGADIAHVACHPRAGAAIRTLSPELIVHPCLDPVLTANEAAQRVLEIAKRVHVVVIGPGLSRDSFMLDVAARILLGLKEQEKMVVLDADALFLCSQRPELVNGYRNAVLTPNYGEFLRLCETLNIPVSESERVDAVNLLSSRLGCCVVLKGEEDIVSNVTSVCIRERGSPRRCGGQGDLLSGIIATFISWMLGAKAGIYSRQQANVPASVIVNLIDEDEMADVPVLLLMCSAACILVKQVARRAFDMKGRAMTATLMVDVVGDVFSESFDEAESKKRN
ncbi:Ribokinase-like protein [Chytriomyces cf. hyalinus JEL632]|nr:Ribokinase-like protein [Chytriomyces cf. hyalinus JEL632]